MVTFWLVLGIVILWVMLGYRDTELPGSPLGNPGDPGKHLDSDDDEEPQMTDLLVGRTITHVEAINRTANLDGGMLAKGAVLVTLDDGTLVEFSPWGYPDGVSPRQYVGVKRT